MGSDVHAAIRGASGYTGAACVLTIWNGKKDRVLPGFWFLAGTGECRKALSGFAASFLSKTLRVLGNVFSKPISL